MAHEQLLRLFLAIDLPDGVRRSLHRLQTRLKPLFNTGTYPAAENLHVTLHFLGDTAVSRLPALIAAFDAVEMPQLEFALEELIYFPDARRARVASIMLSGDVPLLIDLHARMGDVLKSLGFRLDHRQYKPHVTLARFKFPPRGECIEDAVLTARQTLEAGDAFRVRQFTLYQSTLDSKGARYAPLGRFPRRTA